jgi:hypothetical protein
MIPNRTKEALFNYVNYGTPPSGFLRAVLCNDLVEAVGRADTENLAALKEIVQYVYWELPGLCWGNQDRLDKWMEDKSRIQFRETP